VRTLVNLDGSLVSPQEAKVSVLDRGFLYGDSVYEVVRTYGGVPFELDAHLARLAHSAERIGLTPKWDAARTRAEIERTLAAIRAHHDRGEPAVPDAAPWNRGERYIRVIMTRGAGEIGLDPALAVDPVAVIIVQPLHGPPARAYLDGVAVAIAGVRRAPPEAVDPSAKTGAHLANVLAVKQASEAGAHEALLLDAGGFVTEGGSSNVFIVSAGRVRTPPLAAGILEGITRGLVLRLAREQGIAVEETPLRPEDLARADEIFITSTQREILPVTRIGDARVGDGRPGATTRRLHDAFRRFAGGPVRVAERR
jgi:branched-chain amino acid aminotransferase